jgi:hypothetical protein
MKIVQKWVKIGEKAGFFKNNNRIIGDIKGENSKK